MTPPVDDLSPDDVGPLVDDYLRRRDITFTDEDGARIALFEFSLGIARLITTVDATTVRVVLQPGWATDDEDTTMQAANSFNASALFSRAVLLEDPDGPPTVVLVAAQAIGPYESGVLEQTMDRILAEMLSFWGVGASMRASVERPA